MHWHWTELINGGASLFIVATASTKTMVPLRTLATIHTVDEETGHQASFDASHAVLLNAYAEPNGDAVALARDVAARLPALRAALPAERLVPMIDTTVPAATSASTAASSRAAFCPSASTPAASRFAPSISEAHSRWL